MQPAPLRQTFLLFAILAAIAFSFQIALSWQTFSNWLAVPDPVGALAEGTWAAILLLQVVNPFLCLLFGFYVVTVRVEDHRAWLLLLVLVTFSVAMDGLDVHDSVMAWPSPVNHFALVYRMLMARAWAICLLIFSVYFPERATFDLKHPALKWFFLVPCLIAYASTGLEAIARNEWGFSNSVASALRKPNSFLFPLLTWAPIVGLCIVLFVKFHGAQGADSRRRLRLLFAGLALTTVPPLGFGTLVHLILHVREDVFGGWVQFLAYFPLLLLPLVLAYVTIVEKALDIPVVIRQGLRYALAKRGLVFLQLVVSTVVIFAIAVESGRDSFGERLLITALGIALLLSIGLGGRRLANWIDRKFFREAYRAEQILARLAENVRSILELPPLLETVRNRVSEALHIQDLQIFLRGQSTFQPAVATDGLAESWVDPSATRALELARRPLTLASNRLLVPLLGRTELLGFFNLGPRVSEAPYSPSDIELLQSVASQTSFAIENSKLTEKIAAEAAEREVIQRELAFARDVQQRLFPQEKPAIPGLIYAAACRPAREVGGDYYDYFQLADGALGIAIGDVSGKGIAAALLMASLQASLRGQTIGEALPIDCVMKNVNQLIWTTSPANKYATFFFAQYLPGNRTLTYSNGGHNAPFLVSRDREITRLENGGAPVGLFPSAGYTREQIVLSPGDLLVLYTDGISEAMNPHDEEWGEDRLGELLRTRTSSDPQQILSDIFSAADAFAAGEPQRDDMTAMVFSFTA